VGSGEEYSAIYLAAARLAIWACGGVTKGQLFDAVRMVCEEAKLKPQQESLLKDLVCKLTEAPSAS